jgi:chlorite dismutase
MKPVLMSEHTKHGAGEQGTIDVSERGAPKDGVPQVSDRRLFMQLSVFEHASNFDAAASALQTRLTQSHIPSVLYADVNHPQRLGLLTFSEDPAYFVTRVHDAVRASTRSADLTPWKVRPEFAMFGRTYSTGYESDLQHWLLDRPRDTVLHDGWDWAVWYPLKRTGAFSRLDPKEQGAILREHGTIGRQYGAQDLAHDIRLACHGLDTHDNDFVIGLIGASLYPLSHVVQSMRKTKQTGEYMEHMGPFFVGRVIARIKG